MIYYYIYVTFKEHLIRNIGLNIIILFIGISIGLGVNINNIQVPSIELKTRNLKEDVKEKFLLSTTKQSTKTIKKEIPTKENLKVTTFQIQDSVKNKKSSKTNDRVVLIDDFNSLLNQKKYKSALLIYANNANNDTIYKYQKALFSYIKSKVLQKNSEVKKLIQSFLKLEYDNPTALYHLSTIYFNEYEYKKSILLLYKIKDVYVKEQLKKDISKKLNQYITSYLKYLDHQKNSQQKIDFLLFLSDKEPENEKYQYLLAKLYLDLKYYEKSKYIFESIGTDYLYRNKIVEFLALINKKITLQEKFNKKIFLQKKGTHFFVHAMINNTTKVKLLIDTGASLTLIDTKILASLDINDFENINLNTANGTVLAKLTKVDNFAIDNFDFDNFEISISSLNSDFDGLLGMNYLKNFDFYIDQDDAILYLNPL